MSNSVQSRAKEDGDDDRELSQPVTRETGSNETIEATDAFDLLSNKRRRFALHHLKQTGTPVELGELAEHVASWENETSIAALTSRERKRVYTSLQSHHLPKMADQGIIRYDERAGVVELTDAAADVEVYLDIVYGGDVPWSQYYLVLAAVNAVLVGGTVVEWGLFGLLPPVAWAAFAVTTVAVSALVHVYYDSTRRLGQTEKPPELTEQ